MKPCVEGGSKEKAARIANASAEKMDQNPTPCEERTLEELYEKASEVGIEGCSDMSKEELIEALRNH